MSFTSQDITNAGLDMEALGKLVNGAPGASPVVTRTGATYPNVQKLMSDNQVKAGLAFGLKSALLAVSTVGLVIGTRAEVIADPAGDVMNGNGIYTLAAGNVWTWLGPIVPNSIQGLVATDLGYTAVLNGKNVAYAWTDSNGYVLVIVYEDGEVDHTPGPALRLAIADAAGGVSATNIPDVNFISSRNESELRRILFANADGDVFSYRSRRDATSLNTAIPAVTRMTAHHGFGQSNMEGNSGGELLLSVPPEPTRALQLSTGVRGTSGNPSNAVSIPDFIAAREVGSIPSPNLATSPLTSLMRALIAREGNAALTGHVGRSAAQGGTLASELVEGSVPFENLISEAQRIVAIGLLYGVTEWDWHIPIIHGETDGVTGTSIASYKATWLGITNALIARLTAIPQIKTVTIVFHQAATNAGSFTYNNDPAEAQRQLCEENVSGRLFLGETHSQMPLSSAPGENYHSSALGKVYMGELMARTLENIRDGVQQAMELQSATRVGSIVRLVYDMPPGANIAVSGVSGPAVPNRGYSIWNGGAPVTINSVTLVGANQVDIDVSPAVPGAGWECRYAHTGPQTAGWLGARGNIGGTSADYAIHDGIRNLMYHAPAMRKTLT